MTSSTTNPLDIARRVIGIEAQALGLLADSLDASFTKAVDLIFFPLGTNDIITAAVLVPNVTAIVSSKQVFTNGITGLTGTAVDLYNNFYRADNLGMPYPNLIHLVFCSLHICSPIWWCES